MMRPRLRTLTPGPRPSSGTHSAYCRVSFVNLPLVLLLLLAVLLGNGCSVTQFLPEGKYLYDGSSVDIVAPDGVETAELQAKVGNVLNTKTNRKIPLIGYREVYRWYKFEEKLAENPEKYADKEHWGVEPIFYEESVTESVNNLIENRAANEGYFTNESDWELDTNQDERLITATYNLEVGYPYSIDSVAHYWRDTSIARVIENLESETRLKEGSRYELDLVKAERQRWQDGLRDAGYYYSTVQDFGFLMDTVAGDHEVDLLGRLQDDVPLSHLTPQRIERINVYANAVDRDDLSKYGPGDTAVVNGIHLICKECPLRPKIIDEAFAMSEGDLYSPRKHQATVRRLADYNTFRYIAMEYDHVSGSDSLLVLNAYMEPRLRRRFEGELGISYNNADYFGPNARLAYVNRNLLRGAELLRVEGDFTYAQFLGDAADARVPSSGIYGLTATLNVPRLWVPKRRKLIPRVITSGTVIEVGAKMESLRLTLGKFQQGIKDEQLTDLAALLEEDPEATERLALQQYRFQYGYTWKRRIASTNAFNPISIRFQNPSVSTEQVLELAQQINLAPGADEAGTNRFDRMLVISPNFTYTVDGRLNGIDAHELFWQQSIAANMNNVFPVGREALERERETSYYPLIETDFRYYFTPNRTSQIATRVHAGGSFPLFSDRAIVPYFDLFTIGGPNSLRAFIPRQLGPGNTVPEANNLLSSAGFGNVILEASLEYRHRVNTLLELAAFTDVGNIWTYRTEREALATDFSTRAFSGELAWDAGVGFRFDLQFIVFRIDLAYPLQVPYTEAAKELIVPFANARNVPEDRLRLVVAFGYPF